MRRPDTPGPDAIRAQLRRITESPGFVRSERLRRFLTHCVECTLSGRLEDLKEYTIALSAFDRPKHHDPTEDPIVRVEARRLRSKLAEYYEKYGSADPITIQMPKGAYLPTFELRRPEPATPTRKPPSRALYAALVAALIAAVSLLWISVNNSRASAEPVLTRITFDRALNTDPTLSPDGSLLAFASDRAGGGGLNIWIQPARAGAARTESRQLTDDPADDSEPSISPDKSLVAFRSERQPPGIYLASETGGSARLLAPNGRNPRFSPDGRWIAYWTGSPGGASLPPAGRGFVIPSGGGDPRPLLADFAAAVCPVWSTRDSQLLLEASQRAGDPLDLWSVRLHEPQLVRSGIGEVLHGEKLKLEYQHCSFTWRNDTVVISAIQQDTQNLWLLPVSREGQSTGRLQRITVGSAGEAVPFAAANLIAFSSRSETLDIWRMPIDSPDKLVRVTGGETTFPQVADNRLVYLAKSAGLSDVWLKTLPSGKETQVTRSPIDPRYPQLCPGREDIIYSEGLNIFQTTLHQSAPRLLCNGCARVWQCTGRELLFSPSEGNGRTPLATLDLASGSKTTLLRSSDFDLANPQKSPDGWVAFHAIIGPNRRQIFVARDQPPYPIPPGKWVPVTDGTQLDRNAVWGSSGTLYFLSERCGFRCVWKQSLDTATGRPLGPPSAVRHFHSARQGLSSIGDVGAVGLSYNEGNLYFTMAEITADIWIAHLPE